MEFPKYKISLLAVCVFAFTKYWMPVVITSAQIEIATIRHKGWDFSKEALHQKYAEGMADVEMEAGLREKYLNCTVDKSIAFLNQTNCKYYYNKLLTNSVDHLREQDACLAKVGYLAEVEKIGVACASQLLAETKI